MASNYDEEYERFLRMQTVEMKHVLPKQDRTVSKADRKFMEKAAKTEAKQDKKRGRR